VSNVWSFEASSEEFMNDDLPLPGSIGSRDVLLMGYVAIV
jgi:hypothetical protein